MNGYRTRKELHNLLPEDRVVEARRRHGKPFATAKGSEFKWVSGPFFLNRWLEQFRAGKANG
jgi:hypothetical protein